MPKAKPQWREERGPHGGKRWVNTVTRHIQYRDPGHAHPVYAEKIAERGGSVGKAKLTPQPTEEHSVVQPSTPKNTTNTQTAVDAGVGAETHDELLEQLAGDPSHLPKRGDDSFEFGSNATDPFALTADEGNDAWNKFSAKAFAPGSGLMLPSAPVSTPTKASVGTSEAESRDKFKAKANRPGSGLMLPFQRTPYTPIIYPDTVLGCLPDTEVATYAKNGVDSPDSRSRESRSLEILPSPDPVLPDAEHPGVSQADETSMEAAAGETAQLDPWRKLLTMLCLEDTVKLGI